MAYDTWTLWITGLPGAGKSTIARNVKDLMIKNGTAVRLLELDEVRKTLVPYPRYDEKERESVYQTLAMMAKIMNNTGTNVIMDATGHKRKWRDRVRSYVTTFYEVYVDCPIDVCIERETQRSDAVHDMKEMYKKAQERKETGKDIDGLGEVIGVDIPYEETESPELTIRSNKISPEEAAQQIFDMIITAPKQE